MSVCVYARLSACGLRLCVSVSVSVAVSVAVAVAVAVTVALSVLFLSLSGSLVSGPIHDSDTDSLPSRGVTRGSRVQSTAGTLGTGAALRRFSAVGSQVPVPETLLRAY
eukprot:1981271-Rhodomonas_salina.1